MQSKTREVKKRYKTSGKKRRKYLPEEDWPHFFVQADAVSLKIT